MKQLLIASLLCLSLTLTAHSQTTANSKSSGSTFQTLPIRQIPSGCEQHEATWQRVYLVAKMDRDRNATMLSDTTAAFAVYRAEQPKKLKAAYKEGKKAGVNVGLKWGVILTIGVEAVGFVISKLL